MARFLCSTDEKENIEQSTSSTQNEQIRDEIQAFFKVIN
jgi:hypothetical protein